MPNVEFDIFCKLGTMGYVATITIPKKITRGEELVVMPREEYEEFLELRRMQEFIPTPAQKRALLQAERNLRRKKLSYNELVRRLGFTD